MNLRHRSARTIAAVVLALPLVALSASSAAAAAGPTVRPLAATDEAGLLAQLRSAAGSGGRFESRSPAGTYGLLAAAHGTTLGRGAGVRPGATPEQAARGFLDTYGGLVGIAAPATQLRTMRVRPAGRGAAGQSRFQQLLGGVPVLGGELVVETAEGGQATTVTGETTRLPAGAPARITAAVAARTALQAVAGRPAGAGTSAVRSASVPVLWVYDPALLGAPSGPGRLVWRVEVSTATDRRVVLVDAHVGAIALQYDPDPRARNRQVCNADNDVALARVACGGSGLPVVRAEGGGATSSPDVNAAYDNAGEVYAYYATYLGRDGIDGAGAAMVSTVRHCEPTAAGQPCPYPNAAWTGTQMIYGTGYAVADDVVAHEMTHGVTQHESNLIPLYQSGAINEGLSDIAGEIVDQIYHVVRVDDSRTNWLLGEDIPGGALRNMKYPTLSGQGPQPDRMTSLLWDADPQFLDQGGVHTNNGPLNKAAYLIAAGGTFNGHAVNPLGLYKMGRLFYKTQDYLTSGSGYYALAGALHSACQALIGTSVAPPVALTYSSADCLQVDAAIAATELRSAPRTVPPVTYQPSCMTGPPTAQFSDTLENPSSGNWTTTSVPAVGSQHSIYYPQNPNPFGFDATNATSGTTSAWLNDTAAASDQAFEMTRPLVVSTQPGQPTYLRFNASWLLDHVYDPVSGRSLNYDGVIVEYRTATSSAWTDVATLRYNGAGYNGVLQPAFDAVGNPLAGRAAYVGTSNGYRPMRVDVSALAGQSVRFRFRLATDSMVGDYGFWIDDVRVHTCPVVATTSSITAASHFLTSGQSTLLTAKAIRNDARGPAGGATFVLQRRILGSSVWANALVVPTGSAGALTLPTMPVYNTEFRIVTITKDGWTQSISPVTRVYVRPVLSSSVTPSTLTLGQSAVISGRTSPAYAGRYVHVQYLVTAGPWSEFGLATISSTGAFSFRITPSARHTYYVRGDLAVTAANLEAASAAQALRVT